MVAYYNFDTIRKYIIVFSKLFSELYIKRLDTDNTVLQNIKVPIIYGDKSKARHVINSNLETTGVKLPIISMYLEDMQYDPERQKNTMYGHDFISKVDNRIKKYVEHPAPYIFIFSVSIWTKKITDMYKLIQQILPQFKPHIVKNVNILPEMNLSLETKIKYTGNSNESVREFTEDANSVRQCLYTLNFELYGWLFDPIEDRKIAQTIELYDGFNKHSIIDQYGADDIINNKLVTITSYDDEMIKEFTVTPTEDKDQYNHIEDLTTEITVKGENLVIKDKDGEEYPFVFEYDNGEYYGYDNLVPDNLSLSKTGNICMLIPEMLSDEPQTFYVYTQQIANYEFAMDVINLYVDFNRSILRDITIEDKTKNDYVYLSNGSLKLKTVDGTCKVFTNKSIKDGDKFYKIGFSSLTFENGVFIGGLHTENGNNYIYLKTHATNQTVEVHEVVNSVDTTLSVISVGATISDISFDFTSSDLTIDIDGNDYTFTPTTETIIPFLNCNFTNVVSVEYILGYRK